MASSWLGNLAQIQQHVADRNAGSDSLLTALSKTGVREILDGEIAAGPIGGFHPAG